MRLILVGVLAVMLSPVICAAQALSDRVPADALVYFGWRGVDDLGPGFDQSHLKAVLASSQMGTLVSEALPNLITKLASQDPDAADFAATLLTISGPIWHHPTAFYIGGIDESDPNQPMPKAALLCDAGADSAALVQRVKSLIDKGDPDVKKHVMVKTFDHLVVISTFDFVLPDNSLAKSSEFQSALAKVPHDPVLMFYMDGAGVMSTVDKAISQHAPKDIKTKWPRVREKLGLAGLKTIVSGDGFEGANWVEEAFVDAPAPRTGLLAMMDSKPLSDETLKLIPSTATTASAYSFDLDDLYTAVHEAVTQFNPEIGGQWDQAVGMADQFLGIDVEKDLVGAFGPDWASFTDPAIAGNGMVGEVLVNRPRDPKALEDSLTKIENLSNTMLQRFLPHENPAITLQFKQSEINGVKVHYLPLPAITPAWAIKDGVWYFALYPQIVASAVVNSSGKSILDNPGYVDVRKHLGGPAEVSSVSFSDYPRMAPEGYQMLLMISRLYLGVGDIFGLDSPPLVIPPLDKIMAQLEPGGEISWSDESGFHVKNVTPFPGCQMLDPMNSLLSMYMAEGMVMGAVYAGQADMHMRIPPRVQARQIRNSSNLRQIGQGILLYSNDNNGKYPPDLGTLFKTEDLTGSVFITPDRKLPDDWAQMSQDDQAKWVNENSDYEYLGAGMSFGADPRIVVAYEKEKPDSNMIGVLFADGHVDNMPVDAAHRAIEDSKKLNKPGL